MENIYGQRWKQRYAFAERRTIFNLFFVLLLTLFLHFTLDAIIQMIDVIFFFYFGCMADYIGFKTTAEFFFID